MSNRILVATIGVRDGQLVGTWRQNTLTAPLVFKRAGK